MKASGPFSSLVPFLVLACGGTPAGLAGPDLKGLHVALDVGHNKAQGGALSARGRKEFDFNFDMAQSIAAELRSAGAKVSIINEKGRLAGLAERPVIADRLGAAVFLSIHHDSVNDRYLKTGEVDGVQRQYSDAFKGYSVFFSRKNPRAEDSRRFALELGKAMHDAGLKPTLHHSEPIPGENRPLIDKRTGVYEYSDLAVVKYGKLPAALLECGVIVHPEEELNVQTKAYQQKVGKAVASALAAARDKGVFRPATASKPFGRLLKNG